MVLVYYLIPTKAPLRISDIRWIPRERAKAHILEVLTPFYIVYKKLAEDFVISSLTQTQRF